MEQMADPSVNLVFGLSKNVEREIQHLEGFLRFIELENGIMYARIGPKNAILPFLMPHFADRFSLENFVILDEVHGVCGLHQAGRKWFLAESGKILEPEKDAGLSWSAREQHIQELFRWFCHKISIEERKNEDLQRQMLPIRFRKYMTEFEGK